MWSRSCNNMLGRSVVFAALMLLSACGSAPVKRAAATEPPAAPAPTANTPPASAPPAVPPPPAAVADFQRAVSLLQSPNPTEAELELKQLSLKWPQFAGPELNLGLLCRKQGRLEEAQAALEEAVKRNASSAVAWNELGVTLRQRGKFKEAQDAYEHAIAADANFAPTHRNYGVLLDLYLGETPKALAEFERYKELSGEDKPVSGWIAELKQRSKKDGA